MAKVNFYTLKQSAPNVDILAAHLQFTCRLVEKAYGLNLKIVIHAESQAQARELDALLWSFRPDCFLPHQLANSQEQSNSCQSKAPIIISYGSTNTAFNGLLINLSDAVPSSYKQFERISEIVLPLDEQKQISRQHYKLYRDQGFEISTHEV